MQTINAIVVETDEKHFLQIKAEGDEISIPLSEDKPNEVKSAFNKLIAQIKNGVFQIELEDVGSDLFSQVAEEYLIQLNREIMEVREEMEELGLVNAD